MIQQPTVQELTTNIVAQLEAKLSEDLPLLPKAFVHVLAKVLAAVTVLLFKYAGWILLQLFVAHASMEETVILGRRIRPLVEWGRLVGVGDPVEATQAEHVVDVTVRNQIDDLRAGTQLVSPASQVIYQVVGTVALDAPVVQVTVRASGDGQGGDGSGSIGNLLPGDILEFANPLANIERRATVVSRTVDGADAEDPDTYRARVFRRFQRRPQGGAYADYQSWGEELAGILNVYPYTGAPGEVDVYVEATVASSGSEDGIPTEPQLEEVRAAIEADLNGLASRRPANAAVNVYPITRQPFDVLLGGLEAADEDAVLQAIAEGVDDYLRAREPYIVGLAPLPRLDRITQGAVAGIVMGVAEAEGATAATVELQLNGNPITEYTLPPGQKARLGTLS
jgi:uncharacterized phage protein gp47/JayE